MTVTDSAGIVITVPVTPPRTMLPARPVSAVPHPAGWPVPAFPVDDGFAYQCRSCWFPQWTAAMGGAPEPGAVVRAGCETCHAVNECVVRLSQFGRTSAEVALADPKASSHPYALAARRKPARRDHLRKRGRSGGDPVNAADILETAVIFSGLGNLAFFGGVVTGRIGPFNGRPRVDVRLVPEPEPVEPPAPGMASGNGASRRQREPGTGYTVSKRRLAEQAAGNGSAVT